MKTIKSLLVAITALSFFGTGLAHADWSVQEHKQGFIVGGQLGVVNQSPPDGASLKHTIFEALIPVAWRAYTGYQFNEHVAAELGYSLFSNDSFAGDSTFGPDHYKLHAVDLAVKLILPMNKYFNFYIKPGVAYVHQDVFNVVVPNTAPVINSDVNKFTPELGAGAGVELVKNVAMDVSYNRIFKSGIVNNIDFASVGLMVRFG